MVPTDEKVALENLNIPSPGLLLVFVLVENVNGTPPLKPIPEDPDEPEEPDDPEEPYDPEEP